MTQKELADIMSCSPKTVQAIELGKLKLAEERALKLSLRTGVSLDWLLGGDPSAPIIDGNGRPYDLKTFDAVQAQLAAPKREKNKSLQRMLTTAWLCDSFTRAVIHLGGVALSANFDKKDYLFLYRLHRFVNEAKREFGFSLQIRAALDVINQLPLKTKPLHGNIDAWFDVFSRESGLAFGYPHQLITGELFSQMLECEIDDKVLDAFAAKVNKVEPPEESSKQHKKSSRKVKIK